MKVMAIDPGLTTGWVLFTPVTRLQINVLEWGETKGPVAFGQWLQRRWDKVEFDYAVVENYVPYYDRKRTWEPDVLHVIGMVRMACGDAATYLGQTASDAHAWGTESKIAPYRDFGPHVGKGGEGHALMALRHGLNWTANSWNGIQ